MVFIGFSKESLITKKKKKSQTTGHGHIRRKEHSALFNIELGGKNKSARTGPSE